MLLQISIKRVIPGNLFNNLFFQFLNNLNIGLKILYILLYWYTCEKKKHLQSNIVTFSFFGGYFFLVNKLNLYGMFIF